MREGRVGGCKWTINYCWVGKTVALVKTTFVDRLRGCMGLLRGGDHDSIVDCIRNARGGFGSSETKLRPVPALGQGFGSATWGRIFASGCWYIIWWKIELKTNFRSDVWKTKIDNKLLLLAGFVACDVVLLGWLHLGLGRRRVHEDNLIVDNKNKSSTTLTTKCARFDFKTFCKSIRRSISNILFL